MRILIDIGHPAHVHLFRNLAKDLINHGHQVLFTCRDKEFEIQLLKHYGFDYVSFGRKYSTITGKIWGLLKFDIKELLVSLKFKPDIFLSHGSMYAAHAAYLLRKPHIAMEDTFNAEQVRLYAPFSRVILTSDYDHPLQSKKVLRYPGYHELAYLHPNRFTPDISVLDELGVAENQPYVIMRFVSWKASHDVGHQGMSFDNKLRAVSAFSGSAKVFISSEAPLPESLKGYHIPIKPNRMHDALAFASLVFGESSTMSEEAAMLGVPSVYLFNNSTCYTQHLEERYGLLFNFAESESDQVKAIEKGIELLNKPELKEVWKMKRDAMLSERIDVTAFLYWFVSGFPESMAIMKKSPGWYSSFK